MNAKELLAHEINTALIKSLKYERDLIETGTTPWRAKVLSNKLRKYLEAEAQTKFGEHIPQKFS